MSFAKVIALKKPGEFDAALSYEVPASLKDQIKLGQGVIIPLRGKEVRGIVVELLDELTEEIKGLKPISEIIPELWVSERSLQLASRIARYYRCSLLRAVKLFVPRVLWAGKGKRTLKQIEEADYKKPDPKEFPLSKLEFNLTTAQQEALTVIGKANKPVLLHGVTGSGKTEVYLRQILEVAKSGKQSILLVPEIALTPQTIDYFKKYFGHHLAVFHSKLSDGEKLHEYMKVRSGFAPLVIGSRSAIFAPVHELGLIIMDEEHEWTYKQESAPYYETHHIAQMLQSLTDCKVILGSATPRLESFHRAQSDIYEYAELRDRVNDSDMPAVQVVDLREELKRKNYSIFSHALHEKIKERLTSKEQIILFVNQRGMARAIMCRDCGATEQCPSCEVSLKLHGGSYGTSSYLLCHYCAFRAEPKLACGECGSVKIKQVGLGTERVEEELFKFFPQAKVVRADKDTTSDKLGFEPIYQSFKRGEYDILVGTQMVAKGLDFPNVTLIGIILADIGLHIPDFRSHERLFHLITQVSGRAGRGQKPGQVILQTYQPDHHAILKAANYDYQDFAEQEIAFRKKLKYPPFSSLIKFTVVGPDAGKLKTHVESEQVTLQNLFEEKGMKATILAAPAMISKIGGQHYYHVLVRGQDPQKIFEYWQIPKGWRVDIDPIHTS